MTYAGLGTDPLNAEIINAEIKGKAEKLFILRNYVSKSNDPSMTVSYYRQSDNILSASSDTATGEDFAYDEPLFEKNTAYMNTRGIRSRVFWNDRITNRIPVFAKTTDALAEGIVNRIESNIIAAIRAAVPTSAVTATEGFWDASVRSTRHPFDALSRAARIVNESYYKPKHAIMTPALAAYLISNPDFQSQFVANPKMAQMGENGSLGWLTAFGLEIISTNRATADEVIVCDLKKLATWNEVEGIKTHVREEPGRYVDIWSWFTGNPFVTDPKAALRLTNVQE